MPKKGLKIPPRIVVRLLKGLLLTQIKHGLIRPKKDSDIMELLSNLSIPTDDEQIGIITTHEESLLKHATRLFKSRDYEISLILYATYFEHKLNDFIVSKLRAQNVNELAIKNIIRSLNNESRFDFLEIIGLKQFDNEQRKFVKSISQDYRNPFVHYKFPIVYLNQEDIKNKSSWDILNRKIKKSINYLNIYEKESFYPRPKNLSEQFKKLDKFLKKYKNKLIS